MDGKDAHLAWQGFRELSDCPAGWCAMSKIVFIHIPKTAGTSFRRLLDKQYPGHKLLPLYEPYPYTPEVLARLKRQAQQATACIGHVPFGIDRQLGIDARYVTFLRDPVERVVSYYRHNQRHANARFHQQIKEGMTLADLVRSGIDAECHNNMTRMISGIGDNRRLTDRAVLEQAIDNIERRFLFIGLTEQFDQSVDLLGSRLGWRRQGLVKPALNRAPDQKRFPLDEQTRALVLEYNDLDLALYRYVAQRQDGLKRESWWQSVVSLFR